MVTDLDPSRGWGTRTVFPEHAVNKITETETEQNLRKVWQYFIKS
jgi:hypothetical protein